MKKVVFIVCLGIMAIACKKGSEPVSETDFYFDAPQPVNDSELASIPSKFTGIYTFGDERLIVGEREIFYEWAVKDTMDMAELDSLGDAVTYKNNKLVFNIKPGASYSYDVVKKGNTLYLSGIDRDTVFNFSDTQKAKRINGKLVISKKDSVFWKSSILSVDRDSLYWDYLSTKEDFALIKPVIKDITANADTTVVHLRPTRHEFGRILKNDKLGYRKSFAKPAHK